MTAERETENRSLGNASNPPSSTRFKTFNLYPKRLDGRPLPPQSEIYLIIKSHFGADRSLAACLSESSPKTRLDKLELGGLAPAVLDNRVRITSLYWTGFSGYSFCWCHQLGFRNWVLEKDCPSESAGWSFQGRNKGTDQHMRMRIAILHEHAHTSKWSKGIRLVVIKYILCMRICSGWM